MAFLYPAFLLGALAIALPIALHLLRRDVAPEVPFSAVRLLRRSPIDRTRRRRLRDLLLLCARVAALLLLALAFARPYFTDANAAAGLRVVAVDRSYSMGGRGQFAKALEAARAAVDEARGERVAVIAFDDRAEVVAPPGPAADARAALAGLAPGFGGTRFAPAIARAVDLAEGGPAHVVIVSDLQRAGWEDEAPVHVPAAVRVEVREAGAPPHNAAVTRLRAEPDAVAATVASHGAAFTGTARVTIDGREAAATAVRVAAGESAEVRVPLRLPARGALAFSIEDAEGPDADDTRHLLLDPPARARVLILATAGDPQSGLYLGRALEAVEEGEFDVRIRPAGDLASLTAEELARHDAVAILSTRGLDRRGRDLLAGYAAGGGGLLVAAGPDVEHAVLSSALGWTDLDRVRVGDVPVALSVTDGRHPVFRPFEAFAANLGQARFARVWQLPPAGAAVAARFTDGSPALVERRDGPGRALVFASDLDRRWNEFPLHPAFVPFAVEAVRHVAGERDAGRDYLVADAPQGVPRQPGVHDAGGRRVAVNVDVRESAAGRLTPAEFAAMVTADAGAPAGAAADARRARSAEAGQSLWQYGLLLMLGVLIAESAIGKR